MVAENYGSSSKEEVVKEVVKETMSKIPLPRISPFRERTIQTVRFFDFMELPQVLIAGIMHGMEIEKLESLTKLRELGAPKDLIEVLGLGDYETDLVDLEEIKNL
jgi:hypothetical protein